ncbi:GSCFA domain-containing protein [Alphaproteobacteria bacterium KMM 3653]|uniref:GSCFA domain-containing protein n=1 Tax=Harenicola maris TaxID=2841044 RepID=A0AAP2G891_9RHOB|nr:GSCFA domain-containing protein [Harenicola maris]
MTNPYENLPADRFWRSGVAAQTPFTVQDIYAKRFSLTKTDRVAVAGSCFAQHVGRNLRERGFAVVDVEPPLAGMSEATAHSFGLSIYSARYGNIYTARQLLQLVEDALAGTVRSEDFFEKDGRFYDGIRPNIEPGGFASLEEAMMLRRAHLAQVKQMLGAMDVFVFTFGLTEAWRRKKTGTIYPVCPGVIAGEFSDAEFEFVNFNYEQTKGDFEKVMKVIAAVNPRVKYITTVSPVPLTATASGNHVLPATTYSKSVLRAVCGMLYEENPQLDYFPSYELVSAPFTMGQFFEKNMRSVTPEGVGNAMRVFFEAHDPGGTPKAEPAQGAAPEGGEDDLVCEEILLEAFAKD